MLSWTLQLGITHTASVLQLSNKSDKMFIHSNVLYLRTFHFFGWKYEKSWVIWPYNNIISATAYSWIPTCQTGIYNQPPTPFRNSRSAADLSTVWHTWFRRCWASMLPVSVRRPFSLQNVMRTVRAFPVRWSNDWHVLNGGEYRWRLTAGPVWLAFSTRCRPIESGHHSDGNLHCRSDRFSSSSAGPCTLP